MAFQLIDPSKLDWSKARLIQKVAPVQARLATTGTLLVTKMEDGFQETERLVQ